MTQKTQILRYKWITCLVILSCGVLIFGQVLTFEFLNFDDTMYVTKNTRVLSGITWDGIKWALTADHTCNWHPLTWLSHMVDISLFGLKPGAHHGSNLIFHLLNAILLFLIFIETTRDLPRSAFIALLFAVHPLHVESVAWVSERKDVLSTFFWMLSFLSYIRYTREPSFYRMLLVFVMLCLGLMSKPMLVTLPFTLILFDIWPLKRLYSKAENGKISLRFSVLMEKIPLFIPVIISCIVTFRIQSQCGAVQGMEAFPIGVRLSNAMVSFMTYVSKTIFPFGLAAFYPHPGKILVLKTIMAGLFLVFVTLLAFRNFHKKPWIVSGWLWYLGTLIPVIGLVQVGSQALADRYTYIPLIGIFFAVSWSFPLETFNRKRRYALYLCGVIVISVYGFVAWKQTAYWHDGITLFSRTASVTKNNFMAFNNLGSSLAEKGKTEQAISAYRMAVDIKPDYTGARNNLGASYVKIGKIREGIAQFKKVLELEPENVEALNHMGAAFAMGGDTEQAESFLKRAIALQPAFVSAHYNLAKVYMIMGNTEKAETEFLNVLSMDPGNRESLVNLGVLYERQGMLSKAIRNFSRAIQIDPGFVPAYLNLGNVLLKKGMPVEAASCFQQVLRLWPGHEGARRKLEKISRKRTKEAEN